ncbi:hypothetical protein V7S43_014033 [Phytophthora oleae]|uniref:Uncharacterized protein n=1 Tax=Phytophthora oleae TaxID=2107226 RepID=A0ABD3F3E5_9STRA
MLELEGSAAYTKKFLSMICSESSLYLLNKNPATRVNDAVAQSAGEEAAQRPVSTLEVRVALGGGNSPATVKQGSKLLVPTGWKTSDDVDVRAAFKKKTAARDIQVLVVDANELASRVEDDDVAAAGLQPAFFKASGLYDENVVLAMLGAQFSNERHATLRSFLSAV